MGIFNYSSLRGLVREKGYTQEGLAAATGISMTQLSAKLNGRFPFKQKDIQSIVDVLDIPSTEIGRYFFAVEVEKTQHRKEDPNAKG